MALMDAAAQTADRGLLKNMTPQQSQSGDGLYPVGFQDWFSSEKRKSTLWGKGCSLERGDAEWLLQAISHRHGEESR
jgi:hypothetical protein